MWRRAKQAKLALGMIAISAGLPACAARPSRVSAGRQVVVVERIDGPYVRAGTDFEVQLEQPLGTDRNQPGDPFVARVTTPLRAPTGQQVVPKGARVMGTVVDVVDTSVGRLGLKFRAIETERGLASVHATVQSAGDHAAVALVPTPKGSTAHANEFDALLRPPRATAIGGGPPSEPSAPRVRAGVVRIPNQATVRLVLLDDLIAPNVPVEIPPREVVDPPKRTALPRIQVFP